MKSKYSDCNILSIRFEGEQVQEMNNLALRLRLPRNTVIRKLMSMVLADVEHGRLIFE
jgi:predicted DNA-binding protein